MRIVPVPPPPRQMLVAGKPNKTMANPKALKRYMFGLDYLKFQEVE